MNAPEYAAPQCTVIVPTYNRSELLRHTLESLRRQRLPRDEFEVFVVDDGSSDDTADVVDEYRGMLNLRYFFQEDKGFRVAKARNTGIAHANGEICVFIDSGLLLHSGFLQAHLASHRASSVPQAVIGYIYGLTVDDEDIDSLAAAIDASDPDTTIEQMREQRVHLDIREEFYEKYDNDDFAGLPAPWVVFWSGNTSVRTDQLRAVGAFDEAFTTWGGEDTDLGYRLHHAGVRFVVNRDASSIHFPHRKSFEENMRSSQENCRYIIKKYDDPVLGLLLEFPEVDPFNYNEAIVERGLSGSRAE